MNKDIKNKLSQLLDKIDSKVLETKISQAMEMIKNGNQQDLVKKIQALDKQELLSKISELDKLSDEEIENIRKKIGNSIQKEDIRTLSSRLDNEGKQILEKIITTFKIS